MKRQSKGTNMIKTFVVIGDFVLLNAVLLWFHYYASELTPPFFQEAPRTILLVANLSMAIAMNQLPSIIHRRRVKFEQLFNAVDLDAGEVVLRHDTPLAHLVLCEIDWVLMLRTEDFLHALLRQVIEHVSGYYP